MPDSLRLVLGAFTAVPVPAPRRVDRTVARGAMLWAPVVGLVLALFVAAGIAVIRVTAGGAEPVAPGVGMARAWILRSVGVDLLAATLAVVVLAVLTRAVHLGGLAATADGWAARTSDAATRLGVMRRPGVSRRSRWRLSPATAPMPSWRQSCPVASRRPGARRAVFRPLARTGSAPRWRAASRAPSRWP